MVDANPDMQNALGDEQDDPETLMLQCFLSTGQIGEDAAKEFTRSCETLAVVVSIFLGYIFEMPSEMHPDIPACSSPNVTNPPDMLLGNLYSGPNRMDENGETLTAFMWILLAFVVFWYVRSWQLDVPGYFLLRLDALGMTWAFLWTFVATVRGPDTDVNILVAFKTACKVRI